MNDEQKTSNSQSDTTLCECASGYDSIMAVLVHRYEVTTIEVMKMIVGMKEGIEAIELKKCTCLIGHDVPAKVLLMSSGGRIFGDGVGEINIKIENTTAINVDEVQEKMTNVISKFAFEITSTEVSTYASEEHGCWVKFEIKYIDKE